MKLLWATDIHLNFLNADQRKKFYDEINGVIDAKGIIITGDIAEYDVLKMILDEMDICINIPIYIVLGNHDYYTTKSIDTVATIREHIKEWSFKNIRYLTNETSIRLTNSTVLVGVDAWADTREGDVKNSRVQMNDDIYIYEINCSGSVLNTGYTDALYIKYDDPKRLEKIYKHCKLVRDAKCNKRKELADRDAHILKNQIESAVTSYSPSEIIIATHVPPFKEGSKYQGKISGFDYLPYYVSKVTGDVILDTCTTYPDVNFLSLSGHSHHEATYDPLPNLKCRTGDAEYGIPRFEELTIKD